MKKDFKTIREYENITTVKFEKCNHVNNINNEDISLGTYVCNICSNLNNDEYMYSTSSGLVLRKSVIRKCRICDEKDTADKMIAIPQNVKNGISFWFFHPECIDKYGHTKETISKILNTPSSKSKKSQFLSANLIENNIKVKLNKSTLNKINTNKINKNNGNFIKLEEINLLIVNRSLWNNVDIQEVGGIYSILNTAENKRYIGSSRNLYKRFKKHCSNLIKNKHPSYKLQNDWSKYGELRFRFEILEILDSNCNDEMLHISEQKYIDLCSASTHGYNIHPIAGFYGTKTDYNLMQDNN